MRLLSRYCRGYAVVRTWNRLGRQSSPRWLAAQTFAAPCHVDEDWLLRKVVRRSWGAVVQLYATRTLS